VRAAPIRVALVDDAVVIRRGLSRLLEDEGFRVVGQAGTPDELDGMRLAETADVVIMDVRMPPTFTTEGLQAALRLRSEQPSVGILVLSQHVETRYVRELLAAGAAGTGYLLKERLADVADFVAAVRRVAEGGTVVDPEVVAVLMRRSERDGALETLSAREREVLALIAEGLSNAVIGERLHIGLRTVESHVGSVFGKLGLLREGSQERRVLAALRYLRGQA
jgi:DNA-binding NarL/FixJ family response regulator